MEGRLQIIQELWDKAEWPDVSVVKDPEERDEGRILRDNSQDLFKNTKLKSIDCPIGFKKQDPSMYCL